MRALTSSEKHLSIGLGSALFIALNIILFSSYSERTKVLETSIKTLKNDQIEASVWLEERNLWTERSTWLTQAQPALPADGSAASSLLETLQNSAAKNSLKIEKQSLHEPVALPGYQEAAVTLRVSGPLESMVRWLAGLQSPTSFIAVPSFTLKSAKEPPNVICDLKIARYYQP